MIREAAPKDLVQIAEVERRGFPPEEAASREQLEQRLEAFPKHFLLLEEKGKICGYIAGAVTHYERLRDELYEDTSLHDEAAEYQSVFSLVVLPEEQGKGYGKLLMAEWLRRCREERRSAVILTCRRELISFYEGLGFENQGISESVHGGGVWYDMRHNLKGH